MTSRNDAAAPRRRLDPWETGQILDHFVSSFEWTIPSQLDVVDFKFPELFPAELHGQRMLVFSDALPFARVSAGVGLLEDFLKLESASDDAILAYARRWGPLWLCAPHRLPFQHDTACAACVCESVLHDDEARQSDLHDDPVSRDELGDDSYSIWYCELLPGWRSLSRQARAAVRIARRLHDGRSGDQTDWDVLPVSQALLQLFLPTKREPFMTPDDVPFSAEMEELILASAGSEATVEEGEILDTSPDPSSRHLSERYLAHLEELGRSRMASMDFQRRLLGEVLNNWLEMAGVRPRLDWSGSKPAVQLGGHGLIGALAVQLLFECSRTDGLAVCTSCGAPFLPGPRRPRRDRNIYCADCGLKAATRDASARYRQTQKYRATYGNWREQRKPQ